jgi:hypothetical protein
MHACGGLWGGAWGGVSLHARSRTDGDGRIFTANPVVTMSKINSDGCFGDRWCSVVNDDATTFNLGLTCEEGKEVP